MTSVDYFVNVDSELTAITVEDIDFYDVYENVAVVVDSEDYAEKRTGHPLYEEDIEPKLFNIPAK